MLAFVSTAVTQLDLSWNQLCGVDLEGNGTYTVEGIQAFADALRVNTALTRVDASYNSLGEEVKSVLRQAVEGRAGFDLEL